MNPRDGIILPNLPDLGRVTGLSPAGTVLRDSDQGWESDA
jgi:hypothetical protein